MLERVNSNARRYDIAELQLIEEGAQNATAYPLSGAYAVGVNTTESYGTFYFSGYAKGYGADESAESTLSVKYSKLDTIELSLNHTYWRSQTSSLGKIIRIRWIPFTFPFRTDISSSTENYRNQSRMV